LLEQDVFLNWATFSNKKVAQFWKAKLGGRMKGQPLEFRSICEHVGKLFLESRQEIEARDAHTAQLIQQIQQLQAKNKELEAKVRGPSNS
jgi:hypothetical protein